MDVVAELQLKIAREFYPQDPLRFLALTRTTYADVHWKKYNRADRGYFPLDSPAIDVTLFQPVTDTYTNLSNLLTDGKTVIVATSIS